MIQVSFSTMWAQQERFADLARFREVVAGYGYTAIEVSHSTDEAGLRALMTSKGVSLSGLHAPTPVRSLPDGRRNGEANLASLDTDERRLAVSETARTIDFAAEGGLRYVVVHLGGVGDHRSEEERELRRLFESGTTTGEAWDAARSRLRTMRLERAAPHLEAARSSLRELVEYAAPRNVALGLESRLGYHEIPHPEEAADLLAAYDSDVAGFWYDVGHCEVQSRLGMIEHSSWYPTVGSRLIGCHLHDVNGIADHRAPGNGTLDWSMVAASLPPAAVRVLEIDQHEPDEGVANAIEFLRLRGVVL
jgi:sugar phosphate isomerase/epimerase